MPVNTCDISDAELGLFIDPMDDPNFVNPLYEDPVRQPRTWMQIKAFVGTDSYEFNRQYISKSYKDEWLWGTISTCEFQIDDNHPTHFNLPCKLVREQKIIMKDFNGIRNIGYWFIRGNPTKKPYGMPRPNGTYRSIITVECQDAWSLMQAKVFSFSYVQVKAGAILKDAFARAGFDASNIDANAGPTIDHDVSNEYPATVAEQMMALLDWSYWFDIQVADTLLPVPYAGPKDSELIRINLEINESNWDWVFDPNNFELQPASEDYANKVIYTFQRRYKTGKATFQNGSNVMVGYTGDEQWVSINLSDSQGGAEVEIPSTGASYKLQKNNSDNAGVNEFILGSDYAEADTVGGVDYIIKGTYAQITRSNAQAIAQMQALRGGDGIRSKTIVRNDAALTYEEAALVASFELSLYSRQYWRGHGLIATSYNADWLLFWPGRTLPINLPDSKEIVGTLRIEGMRRQEIGGIQKFMDGAWAPIFSNELQFTPSLYDDREQIRALFLSTRKVSSVQSSSIISSEFIENILAIKDCVHIVLPITESDPSILELGTDVDTLAFPTNLGQTEFSYTYTPGYIAMTRG